MTKTKELSSTNISTPNTRLTFLKTALETINVQNHVMILQLLNYQFYHPSTHRNVYKAYRKGKKYFSRFSCIIFLLMQSSRKSFKAFSVAEPIKRQIDQTLSKVELQKRKYLTLERQETYLHDLLQKKRKQLNDLKLKQPETKTNTKRTFQTGNVINNVDRNYLNMHDSIQHIKNSINIHRKEIHKHKQMNKQLEIDINTMISNNDDLMTQNAQIQNTNEEIKDQIMNFRHLNLKNTAEFHQSRNDIHKSNMKDENSRKKYAVKVKSFLGQQMRNSKINFLDNGSAHLNTKDDNTEQVLTQSLPLAKERIKTQIFKNKEKLKITQNYKKFGENLEQMFRIMKEYKGRDDIDFIATQFVTKERQLQKIEEYIAQLETRMSSTKKLLDNRLQEDNILSQEVNTKMEKSDERYAALQTNIKNDIQSLKEKEIQFYAWFSKISDILLPLTKQALTKANASNLIGQIELDLKLKREETDKKNSVTKSIPLPAIDLQDKQGYNELLSYEKMKQFAAEYVKTKKST